MGLMQQQSPYGCADCNDCRSRMIANYSGKGFGKPVLRHDLCNSLNMNVRSVHTTPLASALYRRMYKDEQSFLPCNCQRYFRYRYQYCTEYHQSQKTSAKAK